MEQKRLCLACQDFLPLTKFKRGSKRSLCRAHYNIRHRESQKQKAEENPFRVQSSSVWQMAFIDSQKVFKVPMTMKPADVRQMLLSNKIGNGARLVPIDPCLPLSMENFCLTTSENRREMCNAWRSLRSKPIYTKFFSSELERVIYARSVENDNKD